MFDNRSYNDGLYGLGPGPRTDWNSYNIGKSIRDANERELARQREAAAQPASFPTFQPTTPATGTFGGTDATNHGGDWSITPLEVPPALEAVGRVFGIMGSFVLLLFTLWAFPLLYPLPVVVASGAAVGAFLIMRQFRPELLGAFPDVPAMINDPPQAIWVVLAVAIIFFWMSSRLDHRAAARTALYRTARHGLRLIVIGAAIWAAGAGVEAVSPFPDALGFLTPYFRSPRHLASVVMGLAIWHFMLTRAKGSRSNWHEFLKTVLLRPRSL